MERRETISPARDRHVDLVKVLAICGVVLIHCGAYGDPAGSPGWVQSVVLGSLVRPAVPLFLMCSGAMLLRPEKDLPLRRLLLHNFLRLVTAMLFWAMGYKLWAMAPWGVTAAGVRQAAGEVLLFHQEFHFYYLHMMLLVYLLLPVLRVVVRAADRAQLRYALGFWAVFGIVYPFALHFPPFSLLGGFPLQWQLNMTYAAAGYGLLGWYLRAYPLPSGASVTMFVIGWAVVLGGTLYFSLRDGALTELFYHGMTPGVCLMAAGVYGLVKAGAGDRPSGPALRFLSRGSLCVYLVHVFFLYAFRGLGFTGMSFAPRALATAALAAAILACSYAAYAVLSRIPVVNRWLI